ncbi:NADH-quinone oxidoreductase subunit M [Actinomarinicola tropica]|uniref:NADH-quinone oxidoreductase subunit M n=1 Tax=Actinomarinicola tropica TaxID=2789776 RepID=A0A5Q2RG81_9ACTN|nr:NADH-quinone oxidoreductase subunit M [Actinomarinicola tropica]QGG93812.1 NADH-quinone oxidoreductase subunit M [Actinomarinicola tropica]
MTSTVTSLATFAAAQPFPLLTALVVLPAFGALLVAVLPRRRPESIRMTALLTTMATGAVAVYVLAAFDTADAGFQFVSRQSWISDFGISWALGVDGISLFLVVLTAVIFPIALLASSPGHDPKPYYAWILLLEAGSMGVFLALDLFMFFVFFEIVLVPMYFLIGSWGHGNRVYAAMKFFLYTMFGSAFMLVAILATVLLNAQGNGSAVTFDIVEIATNPAIAQNTARWLFLAFAIAFAVKVPIFPVHTWLPDAHTEAPTAGSVILAAVMLKLGTYGFIRFGLFLFPEAAVFFAPLFLTLGVAGIIYGAAVAAMQKDLKRLVAYSSVAHMGFIVLGIFALNAEGLEGGILQMVNHGISTGALFILVGWIYERRHTRQIAELRGLQKAAPVFAAVFTVVMLSSIGVPGLNGFVGEFLTLIGAFASARWWAVVAAAGVILAAIYLLWAYQRVFHGTPDEANADFRELRWTEGLVMVPLLGLIVFMGVYPKPVLERMEPAVDALVAHIEREVPDFTSTSGPEATEDVELSDVHGEDHAEEADHAEDGSADDEEVHE